MFLAALLVGTALISGTALGDGTETLGPPSIAVASGTSVVGGGTGLFSQPSTITFDVPAGATVKQALLYWNGFTDALALQQKVAAGVIGDSEVLVNGIPVVGELIGGPWEFFQDNISTTFRADITSLGLVVPGANSIQIKISVKRAF